MIKLFPVLCLLVPQSVFGQVAVNPGEPAPEQMIAPPARWEAPAPISRWEMPTPIAPSPRQVEQTLATRDCLEWWAPPHCPPALPALPPASPVPAPQGTSPPPEPETPAIRPESITQPFRPESLPAAPGPSITPAPAPAPSIGSLSAGQGAITGSSYVAMMTGDLFSTGHSRLVIQPSSYINRGPAFTQQVRFDQHYPPPSPGDPEFITGLSQQGAPGPNGGMLLGPHQYAPGDMRPGAYFTSSDRFETQLPLTTVLSDFDIDNPTPLAVRNNPTVNNRISDDLNSRPEYAPGQSYGGGVIAPGGPDFQTEASSLVATYTPQQLLGPLPPGGAGPEAAPLSTNDTFFVDGVFNSSPLVQFNPSAVVIDSLPGGSLASAPGDNVGRVKLSENTSPVPRDRLYVNYSYFDEARVTPKGASVNRVTPGFEKTFLDGNASIEFRAPFAATLDSTIVTGGTLNTDSTEFGNISAYLKALLWNNDVFGISAGCGVSAPTADDFRVRDGVTGRTILAVENESPHVLPFIGAIYAPDERLYAQGLLQFDFDTVGNPVKLSSYDQGAPTGDLANLGRANDASYMFLGGNIGYWIYQGSTPTLPFTGLSPFAEVYYNQTLSRGDRIEGTVNGAQFDSGQPNGLSLVNAVVGLNATMHFGGMLTVAYATPVAGGDDRQYDSEVRIVYNLLFGPQNRFTRAQF